MQMRLVLHKKIGKTKTNWIYIYWISSNQNDSIKIKGKVLTSKPKLRDQLSISRENFLKSMAVSIIVIETENILIMSWCCGDKFYNKKWALHTQTHAHNPKRSHPTIENIYHLQIHNMGSNCLHQMQINFVQ